MAGIPGRNGTDGQKVKFGDETVLHMPFSILCMNILYYCSFRVKSVELVLQAAKETQATE